MRQVCGVLVGAGAYLCEDFRMSNSVTGGGAMAVVFGMYGLYNSAILWQLGRYNLRELNRRSYDWLTQQSPLKILSADLSNDREGTYLYAISLSLVFFSLGR